MAIWMVRLAPFLLVLCLLYMRYRYERGAGRTLHTEEGVARLYQPTESRVTLIDVAGMPEVKEELAEVIDFLRNPARYRAMGARIPRGVLLTGPPGTGKTLLARAVAGEAGVPFFTAAGSEFVEVYAGVGASRVRDLFSQVRSQAPAILFIDEIDAVARQRGRQQHGGTEERDQTLNQLLVEMDGFTSGDDLIVMAASNRPDVLDAALLRPGRFDRQIAVGHPDRLERTEILTVHARGKALAPDVSLERLAAITSGFTGAELANLLNEAALLAARHHRPRIAMAEVTAALERVAAGGPARRCRPGLAERRRIAIHEAGHALVSHDLLGAQRLVKVSIIPRGRALGYVWVEQPDDRWLPGREELLDQVACMLAGRAAEELETGEVSSGAADDLERATALVRQMAAEWGMSAALGPICLSPDSEKARLAVDLAARELMDQADQRARRVLQQRRSALRRTASALLEQETLEGARLAELLQNED